MTLAFRIVPAGDAALVIAVGDAAHRRANPTAIALARLLSVAGLPGVRDVVPTTRSVGVHFDPVQTTADVLSSLLTSLIDGAALEAVDEGRTVDVPVCYGGAHGPDLGDVARHAGVDEATVMAMHQRQTYVVAMVGFAPGFAYLGDVEAQIAMPRRAQPRARVAAGSVGIAETQTGIYPFEMPGGWQIIGRTPFRPCDFRRTDPFLLTPGDRVRFRVIDNDEYARLSAETPT